MDLSELKDLTKEEILKKSTDWSVVEEVDERKKHLLEILKEYVGGDAVEFYQSKPVVEIENAILDAMALEERKKKLDELIRQKEEEKALIEKHQKFLEYAQKCIDAYIEYAKYENHYESYNSHVCLVGSREISESRNQIFNSLNSYAEKKGYTFYFSGFHDGLMTFRLKKHCD